MYTTLITAPQLHQHIASGQPVGLMDCSFDLMSPTTGRQQFEERHIPGAQYVHLDEHLSDKTGPDRASGGRHPLPSRETFARRLTRPQRHSRLARPCGATAELNPENPKCFAAPCLPSPRWPA